MGVVAVILAAGGSTRMGTCKALLEHPQGGTLLEAHIAAYSPHCTSIIVVAGAHRQAIEAHLPPGCTLVNNPSWEHTDPFYSLKLGLKACASTRWIITPVDTPPVSAGDLSRLLENNTTSVLCWKGKPGHPVLLDEALVHTILAAEEPQGGLRELLVDATQVKAESAEVLLTWNTPEQWQKWHDSAGIGKSC